MSSIVSKPFGAATTTTAVARCFHTLCDCCGWGPSPSTSLTSPCRCRRRLDIDIVSRAQRTLTQRHDKTRHGGVEGASVERCSLSYTDVIMLLGRRRQRRRRRCRMSAFSAPPPAATSTTIIINPDPINIHTLAHSHTYAPARQHTGVFVPSSQSALHESEKPHPHLLLLLPHCAHTLIKVRTYNFISLGAGARARERTTAYYTHSHTRARLTHVLHHTSNLHTHTTITPSINISVVRLIYQFARSPNAVQSRAFEKRHARPARGDDNNDTLSINPAPPHPALDLPNV